MAAVPAPAAAALDSHRRLADQLDTKISAEPPYDGPPFDSEPPPPPAGAPLRDRLMHMVHSYKYQAVVIALVLLDCVCVIAELLIDLEISADSKGTVVKEILHNVSIAILSLFLLEIVVKLYVFRLSLFRMPWELFDALVVIVSFALDVAYHKSVGPVNGAGLIIILRLWRVTRIVSGMVLSVRRHAEHRLELARTRERELRAALEASRHYCAALELRLSQHGLPLPTRDAADDSVPGGESEA